MSEHEFAANYLLLLSLSSANQLLLNSDHSIPLKSLSSLHLPKLPNLPVLKSSSALKQDVGTDNLANGQFKSIKPPKFNVDLKISDSLSIFEVKKLLIKEVQELKSSDTSQIKLLLKGKVCKDGEILKDLPEDLRFTVMLANSPILTPPNSSQEAIPVTNNNSRINDSINNDLPWYDILKVLENNGFTESDLKRLQKGWELTQ